MSEKIRLLNKQKFDVGIVLPGGNENQRGVNIKAGSFFPVTADELDYIASVSTLIQRGILTVEEKNAAMMENIGIDMKNDPNFITDEEIHKRLSGSAKKIGEWLDTITEDYILDRVYDEAVKMDLGLNKLKVLQEKMPKREFLE